MHILNSETLLATGINRLGREIYLIHRRAGMYPAGSRAIHKEEGWGVLWEFEGSRHGQWFETPEKGRDEFDSRNVGAGA